jgi:hypothetical protein
VHAVTIFVDEARWPGRSGVRFAHLVSDSSFAELHEFVAALPVERPLRFHGDHYDVPAPLWEDVLAAGATVVSAREIVVRLRAAGLRRGAQTSRSPASATSAGSGPRRRDG